jgi:hypothetical protein
MSSEDGSTMPDPLTRSPYGELAGGTIGGGAGIDAFCLETVYAEAMMPTTASIGSAMNFQFMIDAYV